MDKGDKKELAKKMETTKGGAGRKPLPSAAPSKTQSSLSFFGDEADGWQLSPKTILLFSVAYMGCVILLHIFAKVTSIKKAAVMDPSAGAGAGGAGDL